MTEELAHRKMAKSEYLQIVGLLTLAARYSALLKEIVESLREITGENDDMGHCMDAVYQPYDPDELLKKLKIEVEP